MTSQVAKHYATQAAQALTDAIAATKDPATKQRFETALAEMNAIVTGNSIDALIVHHETAQREDDGDLLWA